MAILGDKATKRDGLNYHTDLKEDVFIFIIFYKLYPLHKVTWVQV